MTRKWYMYGYTVLEEEKKNIRKYWPIILWIFSCNWLNFAQSSLAYNLVTKLEWLLHWYTVENIKLLMYVYIWFFSMDFMDWVTLTLVVPHVTVMWVGQSVRPVTRKRGRVLVNQTSLVSSVTSPAQDITTPCWIISSMKLNLPKDLE